MVGLKFSSAISMLVFADEIFLILLLKDIVIAQSVLVLRSLLQSSSLASTISRVTTIQTLAHLLLDGHIKFSSARVNIYWLIGQYASTEGGDGSLSIVTSLGPDSLRLGALQFATEVSSFL